MELMERYIYATTRRLPSPQRKEVGEDLRTMIEDMAAARAKKGKPTEADYETAIKELGAPEKMALEYGKTHQYLIGPRTYDLFMQMLKLVLWISLPIIAVVVSLANIIDGQQIVQAILGGVGTAVAAAIHIAFWTVVTFAIMERAGMKLDLDKPEWTIDNLPELPKDRQISIADSIAGIVMILVSMAVVTFASTQPMWWTGATEPVLNSALWNGWIQGFLALSTASLLLEIAKYRIGNWTPVLAAINVTLAVVWAVFISVAVLTQVVINPAFISEVQARGVEADLKQIAEWTIGMTVVIAIASSLWSGGESIYKAVALKRG